MLAWYGSPSKHAQTLSLEAASYFDKPDTFCYHNTDVAWLIYYRFQWENVTVFEYFAVHCIVWDLVSSSHFFFCPRDSKACSEKKLYKNKWSVIKTLYINTITIWWVNSSCITYQGKKKESVKAPCRSFLRHNIM